MITLIVRQRFNVVFLPVQSKPQLPSALASVIRNVGEMQHSSANTVFGSFPSKRPNYN